jgi:hypothetical protein
MEQYGFVRLHAREGEEIYVAAEERGARCIVPLRVMLESRRFRASAVRFLERVDALLDRPREMARTEIIG